MYLLRLDDASEYMDITLWQRIENILDTYSVKPLVGIIPNDCDPTHLEKYEQDSSFWEKAQLWADKKWGIALHGYDHKFCTKSGGINPVNKNSEFASLPLSQQEEKIKDGLAKLKQHNLLPTVFFAPGHTYDESTLQALRTSSDIRIISDTFANNLYYKNDFFFVPVQSGVPRKLFFKLTTICLHPNSMLDSDFEELEGFLKKNSKKITSLDKIVFKKRKLSFYDKLLSKTYFIMRSIKAKLR